MLKPTTNRKKQPFISAWPWAIQTFVLGTLQGLATRNGCTNMHANVAHHEQLLQAQNDTWKGTFFFCAVSFPPNASAAGETPLLSPKPFPSRATAVRYGFPSDSGSDPPRDRNLYVHRERYIYKIYIYIMIYHEILYNISIVFMGFIGQLMMPNAYF